MTREKWSYAVALFALKLPPGCHVQLRPGGVTYWGHSAAPCEVFLRAGYALADSPQEAEARWLEFLRGHLPASNGWVCHSVSVEDLSDLDKLFDELLDRVERGDFLSLDDAPGSEDEDMPELPM